MNALKKIKKLDVEADATIELVELNGRQLILKTGEQEEVALEKKFIQILSQNHVSHLELFETKELLPNQLLIEYVVGSPTLDKNQSTEWYRKFGEITKKMHQVKSDKCTRIMANGEEVELAWQDFIKSHLSKNIKRHKTNGSLEESVIDKVADLVHSWLNRTEEKGFSLIHGDLHNNNAMIKGQEVVLFDKGSYMLYGNRLYDLAIVAIDYYSEKYDPQLFKAFIEGYGEDFLLENKNEIDLWVILRCFERYPNRFESYSRNVLNKLLSKY